MNDLRRKRPVPMTAEDIDRAAAPAPLGVEAEPRFEDEAAALRRCLAELEDADRQVLAARYERSRPLANIAGETGQTVGYLKQRLMRLRRRLAVCIRKRMQAAAG